jgi:hypothetical protein
MLTATERRIVEFLFTANPAGLRELPDWLLRLLDCDPDDHPSPELLMAGTLLEPQTGRSTMPNGKVCLKNR